ncbi:MAG: hypothetical protein ACLFV0_00900 [Nitriliruptoraceae bacterium]
MPIRPSRLLASAVLFVALTGCGTDTDAEPAAAAANTDGETACTTSIELTKPDGTTSTLDSANIQTIYGGEVVTVFAADFPIAEHDVAGRPPDFPTESGQLVWLDLGEQGAATDDPQLGTGDTATLPGTGRTAFAASLITAERIDPLFGEDLAGTIDLQRLEDDGACIDIDVTIAGVTFQGTAAADTVLRGE